MKVTESYNVAGFTVIAAVSSELMRASRIRIDEQEYDRVVAYDIGDRIAIRGVFDFAGKKVEVVR